MQSIFLDPVPGSDAILVGYVHDPGDQNVLRNVRPCVIVCPGGGYSELASHEAEPVAMEFYTQGYQAFVLSYSLRDPCNPAPLGLTPLRDASLAVMTLRKHCDQWRIDPERIAICGFSAGGHLAASLGTLWDSAELKAELDTEGGLNRPNALILCYPVITAGGCAHSESIAMLAGDGDHSLFSLEKQVNSGTPPTFLWHTANDKRVSVENSLLFADAMRKAGVSCETHIFAHGPHGMGLANNEARSQNKRCAVWMSLCTSWLNDLFDFPL